MKTYLASIVTSSLLMVSACGGSDLDPGSGDDPGTGNATLTVEGRAHASPRVDNARAPGDFETDLEVRITRSGVPVETGAVRVTSASGTIDLVFDASDNEKRWKAKANGYDQVYVLDIESGEDHVVGVRVDGPDLHYFTSPAAGATVDASAPITLAWTGEDTADSAVVKTKNMEKLAVADTGSYAIPIGALEAKRDEAKDNELRLTRTDRVVPAGAAGGSEFTVSIDNRMIVIAQPDPSL